MAEKTLYVVRQAPWQGDEHLVGDLEEIKEWIVDNEYDEDDLEVYELGPRQRVTRMVTLTIEEA